MINLTRELRHAPFPPGFYVVCGSQGAGKTALCTAIFRTDYRRHRKTRKAYAIDLAQRYYAAGGPRLDVDDVLYFSNTEIVLDARRGITTHCMDLQLLGLPNDDFEVQYLPRGSMVFIQEADLMAFCRDWQTMNSYLIDLMKYVRHNLLTVIFDCQSMDALDAALRRLIIGKYYVLLSGVKGFWLFRRQKWKFLYVRTQLNSTAKELSSLGVPMKLRISEYGRFRVRGDVFRYYNSFSGEPYFLYGIENVGYKYRKHSGGDLSPAGVMRYCLDHPLTRPDEMLKKRKKV